MAEVKAFLLVRQTYKVKCRGCGFKGKATLGDEPIQTEEAGGETWCPVCGALALVGNNFQEQ